MPNYNEIISVFDLETSFWHMLYIGNDTKMKTNLPNTGKQKMYLKAEALLRYLIGKDDKLDTLIMCKGGQVDLMTSDQSLYEALGSIQGEDDFKLSRLVKMMEVVDVVSYVTGMKEERKILKNERVDELRKLLAVHAQKRQEKTKEEVGGKQNDKE